MICGTKISVVKRKGECEMKDCVTYDAEREQMLAEIDAAPEIPVEAGSTPERPEAGEETGEKLEFNRETVERLLAEGWSKGQIRRHFNVSVGKLYGALTRWGLHEVKHVGRGGVQKEKGKSVPPMVSSAAVSGEGEGITLADALGLKTQAEFKLRSIQRVLHEARGFGVQVADVVIQDLVEIENKYAGQLRKIEAALEKVRVVI